MSYLHTGRPPRNLLGSPLSLLYGRKVRGPLDELRENWTGERLGEPSLERIINVRKNCEEMTGLVRASLEKAQGKQKVNYDEGAVERTLETGKQVLVLLPNSKKGLKLGWMGPFTVTRRVGALNYDVVTPGGRKGQKVYHINLLKKWHKADEVSHAFLAQFEGEDMDADFLPVL